MDWGNGSRDEGAKKGTVQEDGSKKENHRTGRARCLNIRGHFSVCDGHHDHSVQPLL